MEPYRCIACLADHDRWAQRCPVCGHTGSLIKLATLEAAEVSDAALVSTPAPPRSRVRTVADAPDVPEVRYSTGIPGFDRVLGGGMVSPSVVVLAANPGCGKSTLMLPMFADLRMDRLLIAAEESDVRLRRRAIRCGLGDKLDRLPVLHTKDFNEIMEVLATEDPRVVLIDSINVLKDKSLDKLRDDDANILRNVETLYKDANDHDRILFLIAQMNAEGSMRGTKELQHLVDAIVMMTREGPRRVLRCPEKNRDGSLEAVAVFQMTEHGLIEGHDAEPDDPGPVADRGETTVYMSEPDIPLPKTRAQRTGRAARRAP